MGKRKKHREYVEIDRTVTQSSIPITHTEPSTNLLRHLCSWQVGPTDNYEKLVTYVLAGNGVFCVRKCALGKLVSCTSEADIPGLPSMVAGVEWKVPKIPCGVYGQVVRFFSAVYRKLNSEAYAQIWYKHTGEWEVVVPKQEVDGAHVRGRGIIWTREDAILVADLHSHADMDPFFSKTDNDDDRGRHHLQCVVGKLKNGSADAKWRVSAGSEWMDLEIEDVIDCDTIAVSLSVALAGEKMVKQWMIKQGPPTPAEWLDQCKPLHTVIGLLETTKLGSGYFERQMDDAVRSGIGDSTAWTGWWNVPPEVRIRAREKGVVDSFQLSSDEVVFVNKNGHPIGAFLKGVEEWYGS